MVGQATLSFITYFTLEYRLLVSETRLVYTNRAITRRSINHFLLRYVV